MPKTYVSSMTSKLRQFEAFVQWNMEWNAQVLREWLNWLLGREYVLPSSWHPQRFVREGNRILNDIKDIAQGAIG